MISSLGMGYLNSLAVLNEGLQEEVKKGGTKISYKGRGEYVLEKGVEESKELEKELYGIRRGKEYEILSLKDAYKWGLKEERIKGSEGVGIYGVKCTISMEQIGIVRYKKVEKRTSLTKGKQELKRLLVKVLGVRKVGQVDEVEIIGERVKGRGLPKVSYKGKEQVIVLVKWGVKSGVRKQVTYIIDEERGEVKVYIQGAIIRGEEDGVYKGVTKEWLEDNYGISSQISKYRELVKGVERKREDRLLGDVIISEETVERMKEYGKEVGRIYG